jgi:hypothetical protein
MIALVAGEASVAWPLLADLQQQRQQQQQQQQQQEQNSTAASATVLLKLLRSCWQHVRAFVVRPVVKQQSFPVITLHTHCFSTCVVKAEA